MASIVEGSFISASLSSISLLTMLILVWKLLGIGKRAAGLPPGPPTLPILGNLHLMPNFKPYKTFTEWGKIYGPIYSLMAGSSPIIMLQSHKIAKDLFDKRGGNYSSRPNFYILSDVASRGLRMVAMKYNNVWRQIHKINHSILNVKAIRAYTPYQLLESRQMLVDILESPSEHKKHIQRYSNSVTCQMVHGFRTTDWSDPRLQSVTSIFWEVCDLAMTIPAQLMDCYPILQKIPKHILPVCRKAMDLDRRSTDNFVSCWMEGKRKALNGTAMPCFVTSLAQIQEVEGFSDELAAYIAGEIVEASSSTTSDELFGFLLAMVTHPDVQKMAQKEIDSIIGDERLPTIDDMASLPYIRGCVRETLRWMPTTALLIPHSPVKDDVYEGHTIPAGASVILNVWALNMDPERWPDPRQFDPLRFKDETRSEHEIAVSNDTSTTRHNYVFGAGRRLCQGIHIAERSLFLAMACMLWAFEISTSDPSSIDTEDLRGGLAVVPAPFECNIKLRSAQRAEVLRREWQKMQDDFLDPVTKQWIRTPNDLPQTT